MKVKFEFFVEAPYNVLSINWGKFMQLPNLKEARDKHPNEAELLKFARQVHPSSERIQSHLTSCASCLETLTIFHSICDSESDDVVVKEERADKDLKDLVDLVLSMIESDEARLQLN